ncbi:MAG: hypothetical protein EPN57_11220 [Paraburkholderia sp.]|nr:MAG: hypothetical protein EPN57_11220 [Paraburkholderia sp.]
MSAFDNKRKKAFLAGRELCSLDDPNDSLVDRCKFNFHYFTVQDAGQNFPDWSHGDLISLLQHIKEYCNFPLSHWMRQPIGKSGTVLAIYGGFPKKSDFSHPKHVPHQARWGRFRLNHSKRLIGFTIPPELNGVEHRGSGLRYCSNTFYAVFLDADHRFWVSGEAK